MTGSDAPLGWICPLCHRCHAPSVAECSCSSPQLRGPVADIISAAAAEFGVSPDAIVGPSRHRSIVAARHAAMWLARAIAGRSTTEVGMAFHRDHTSVMHACAKIDNADPETRSAVGRVRARLAAGSDRERLVLDTMHRAQIAAWGRAG